jgi:hypothetical protein
MHFQHIWFVAHIALAPDLGLVRRLKWFRDIALQLGTATPSAWFEHYPTISKDLEVSLALCNWMSLFRNWMKMLLPRGVRISYLKSQDTTGSGLLIFAVSETLLAASGW